MTTIGLKFLTGRFHATPWGRHVNEGAVEWPPSPWRFLRALVAVWKRTRPDLLQAQVEPMLRLLAEPPRFGLPSASTGHTRHFMPWFKKGPQDKTLIFDVFVSVAKDEELRLVWPAVDLTAEQRGILAGLLGNLNVFGRSESWIEARLLSEDQSGGETLCHPLGEADALKEGQEVARLLCADVEKAFGSEFVAEQEGRSSKGKASGMGRALRKEGAVSMPLYDPNWNLCVETLKLHEEKWSDPPGAQWVPYARSTECFKTTPRPRPVRVLPLVTTVRYALDSTVLPLLTDTLPLAEAARSALMGLYGALTAKNGFKGKSEVFAGKDEAGHPLQDHRHAYYLPTDEDGDGRLDHLTVFARGGLGETERRALDRFREFRNYRNQDPSHPLRLLLLGLGSAPEYVPAPLGSSKVWVSATPYIATRHAKTRGPHRTDKGSPEDCAAFLALDLRAQLSTVRPGWDEALGRTVKITPLWDAQKVFRLEGGQAPSLRPIQFQRFRRNKSSDDGDRRLAGFFRLEFQEPVRGPLAFGHSAHFGMGLFLPGPIGEAASGA